MAALLVACQAAADESQWPVEWFTAAKTASEIGLTSFRQSPMLDGLDLPPVAQRLPDDPVVVYPLHSIGRYGGNARITRSKSVSVRISKRPDRTTRSRLRGT